MTLPVVAIVGRQNVGKSSLLNALVGRRLAIVHPHPGITRDRVGAIARLGGRPVELVDTGGLAPVRPEPLFEDVRRQVTYALERAALVLFVVDAQEGLTPGDEEVARLLRRRDGDVVLVANKVDHAGLEAGCSEFYRLGFGDPVAVSAAHRRGTDMLRELVARRLGDAPAESPATPVRVTIVGRRNVGKSTFVNALAGEERVIVDEKPGTTRDAVDVWLRRGERTYVITDTAGLRRRGRMDSPAEFLGSVRAQERLRDASAVVFMLDATEKVTALDRRIARQIHEERKVCVFALNKWDRVTRPATPKKFVAYLAKTLPLLSFAPVCCVSAKEGLNVWETLELAGTLVRRAATRIPTPQLNRRIRELLEARTSPGKFLYAAQTGQSPPAFRLFVNDPRLFKPEYRADLEHRMREALGLDDLPMRLDFVRRARSTSRGRRSPTRTG
jgi:GTP-binding protein